jgi:sec-independent protein translocase protein TatC
VATNPTPIPPDDDEERRRKAGEMTILEHLLELRMRVMWIAIAIVLGMCVFFAPPVGFRVIEFLKEPALKHIEDFAPQAITPMENIVVYFKVALLGGIALAMPMIVFQTFRFISPALMPNEKRWVYPIAFGSTGMFALGMAFAYYVVLPQAYGFLFQFGADEIAVPAPTISSYMDLTTRLILVVGLAFETPIVIMGLAKFGIVSAQRLRRAWRFAIVIAFIASAILTPTPDPVTQTLVAGPIIVLYFLGVGLAWFVRKR